jgi:hypothetical protein
MSDNNGAPEKTTTRAVSINRLDMTSRVDELAQDLREFIQTYYDLPDAPLLADQRGREPIILTEVEAVQRMADVGIGWPLALSMVAGELLATVAHQAGSAGPGAMALAERSVEMLESTVERGYAGVLRNCKIGEEIKRRRGGH